MNASFLHIKNYVSHTPKGIFERDILLKKSTINDANLFFTEIYKSENIDYPKFYKMDNLSKMCFLAIHLLLKNTEINSYQTNVVLLNSSASLDGDINYFKTVASAIPSPAQFVYTLPNIAIGEICIYKKIKGENIFFIFEEFQPKFVVEYVQNLLQNKPDELCVCGWLELLNNEFCANLFLVGSGEDATEMAFTEENILKLFQQNK